MGSPARRACAHCGASIAALAAEVTDLRRSVLAMHQAVESLTVALRTAPVVRSTRRPVASSEAPAAEPRLRSLDGPPTVPPAGPALVRDRIDPILDD